MLANSQNILPHSGALDSEAQRPGTFRHELLDFIARELPRWRDRPTRPEETSENTLTFQLATYLTGVARHSEGWDIVQFQVEGPDEKKRGRKIDLVPIPSQTTIIVEDRKYTEFHPLLPIECKRLPTPSDPKRDEREYVISTKSSTGGIQRFKQGNHGAAHEIGAMIGYIQEHTADFWEKKVGEWISDLISTSEPGWTVRDQLSLDRTDAGLRISLLRSSHERANGLPNIEIRHLWIEM